MRAMNTIGLDHLVLTVSDIDETVAFYVSVLGMRQIRFGRDPHTGVPRTALAFGTQKINLHEAGREVEPHADSPAPGTADLCLLVSTPLDEVEKELRAAGVDIELGPVERTGATGPILSVYLRDPDRNLIELSNPIVDAKTPELR